MFEFLVNPLRLSIRLRVIGRCGCKLDPEEPVLFPCELSDELRAPVRNNPSREPVEFPNVSKVKPCGAESCDHGVGGDEMGSFAD